MLITLLENIERIQKKLIQSWKNMEYVREFKTKIWKKSTTNKKFNRIES